MNQPALICEVRDGIFGENPCAAIVDSNNSYQRTVFIVGKIRKRPMIGIFFVLVVLVLAACNAAGGTESAAGNDEAAEESTIVADSHPRRPFLVFLGSLQARHGYL